MNSYETIKLDSLAENVLEVVLGREGSANAMNTLMSKELKSAFQSSEVKSSRAVILTGSGSKAFCAGADLKERNGMAMDAWKEQHHHFEEAIKAISRAPAPVIAKVNGAAYGGGLEIILACDFAYAVPEVRFCFSETRLGIIPGLGGIYRLVKTAGVSVAKEIVLTAAPFESEQALEWGVVNKLVEKENIDQETLQSAKNIAANAPLALSAGKDLIECVASRDLDTWTELELKEYYKLVESEDRAEGILAFNEKRKAEFKGS